MIHTLGDNRTVIWLFVFWNGWHCRIQCHTDMRRHHRSDSRPLFRDADDSIGYANHQSTMFDIGHIRSFPCHRYSYGIPSMAVRMVKNDEFALVNVSLVAYGCTINSIVNVTIRYGYISSLHTPPNCILTYFLCLFALKQAQWHEHIDVSSPVKDTVSWPIWPLNMESLAVITSPSNRTDTCNACEWV